jgi:hypothetical protein
MAKKSHACSAKRTSRATLTTPLAFESSFRIFSSSEKPISLIEASSVAYKARALA